MTRERARGRVNDDIATIDLLEFIIKFGEVKLVRGVYLKPRNLTNKRTGYSDNYSRGARFSVQLQLEKVPHPAIRQYLTPSSA